MEIKSLPSSLRLSNVRDAMDSPALSFQEVFIFSNSNSYVFSVFFDAECSVFGVFSKGFLVLSLILCFKMLFLFCSCVCQNMVLRQDTFAALRNALISGHLIHALSAFLAVVPDSVCRDVYSVLSEKNCSSL